MKFGIILIFAFLVHGPLLAEENCNTNNNSCLKKLAQVTLENDNAESFLKISLINCLYNEDCVDFNRGINDVELLQDVKNPDVFKAIHSYIQRELPLLKLEKIKNGELTRKSQIDDERIFDLQSTIKRLNASFRKVNSSKKIPNLKENPNLKEISNLKENTILKEMNQQNQKEISILKEMNQQNKEEISSLKKFDLIHLSKISDQEKEISRLNGEIKSSQTEENNSLIIGAKKAASFWKKVDNLIEKNTGKVFIIQLTLIGILIIISLKYKSLRKFFKRSSSIDEGLRILSKSR